MSVSTPLAERLIANYTYGLGLVSQIDSSGTTAYYDFDAIGSTVGISSVGGTYVNTYRYLPFGETLSVVANVANPFEYVGQYGVMQTANGSYDMRARGYVSSIGRFLVIDPLGLRGGDYNMRRYADNSPVNEVDPTGTIT